MRVRVIVQTAKTSDLRQVAAHRRESLMDVSPTPEARRNLAAWLESEQRERLPQFVADHSLLVARAGRRLVGSVGLDVDSGMLKGPWVTAGWRRCGVGTRLVVAAERLAVQFGMERLGVEAPASGAAFFLACGYAPRQGGTPYRTHASGADALWLERHFPRRQTPFGRQVQALLAELGISGEYGRQHRLRLVPECAELATIGSDLAGREQFMHPAAALAWHGLRRAAAGDGIELQVVSAFRSVAYQATLIRNKLAAGQELAHILEVSAAPGFSEHHSGRALDLSCPDSRPLETEFENTPAFEWLAEQAEAHGFRLSFPRNNRHGIAFEPWHWAWID